MYCVHSLFSFSCLSNTLSPSRISLSRAFLGHSAYTFPFAFLSLSQSVTSSSMPNSWRWGSLILIRLLNNSSAWLTLVVECGVLRYIIKKLSISDFQLRPSAWAIRRRFRILRFCLSFPPLACGYKSTVRLYVQFRFPFSFASWLVSRKQSLSYGTFAWGLKYLFKFAFAFS